MLREVNRFLAGKRGYVVVAESGDMLFAGLDVRVGRGGGYFAQGYYASMGFGVPGALGCEIGTGQAADRALRRRRLPDDRPRDRAGAAPRLRPIVVLMNNGGWGIFRPIAEREDLLTIPNWPYAELARAWGGAGYIASTVGEFRDALAAAEQARELRHHRDPGRILTTSRR